MKHRTKPRKATGFTLIEILVVVLILGILTSIALPAYLSNIPIHRQAACNANIKALATAVQSYGVFSGAYNTTLASYASELGGSIPVNPCTNTTTDYTITSTSSVSVIVTANPGTYCGTWTPASFTLTL